MNSKFYIALKRVYHRWYDSPIAIEDLTSAYNELLSFMIDPKNQLNNNLKGYARGSYNEITELQLVYEKHNKKLWENDFKKLTSEELDKLQLELDYYSEVLSLCEDARAILLEYLANYYPELFEDEQWLPIFKELLRAHPFTIKLRLKFENDTGINLSEKEITSSRTKGLKMSQIALLYSYKEERITRGNCDEIANAYGFPSKTSGQKLYQQFNKYSRATDRKGDGGTKRKNKYKLELIESIIDLLPDDEQEKAKDEIKILKNILENQYE